MQLRITGVSQTVNSIETLERKFIEGALHDIHNSYKRYQLNAFKRAPVKYGYLSSALVDDRFTTINVTEGDIKITQREGVDYMIYQEIHNPNGKERFIRNSIIEEAPRLSNDIQRTFKEVIRSVT